MRVSESLRLASEARDAADAEPETALLVAWEALLWNRNELSEGVFREAIGGMPAPVKILRQPRTDIINWISAGFAAGGDTIFAAPARGNELEVWSADGATLGSVALPGSGPIVAASSPGLRAVVTYRDEVIRLHQPDGKVVAEVHVEGAAEAAQTRSDPTLEISSEGVCLLRCEAQGWLFGVNPGRPGVAFVRSLTFQSKSDLEGPLHGPQGTVLGSTMDGSGQRLLTWAHDHTIRVWSVEGERRSRAGRSRGWRSRTRRLHRGRTDRHRNDDGLRTYGLMTEVHHGSSLRVSIPVRSLFVCAVDVDGEHFATSVNRSGVVRLWDSSGTQLAELHVSNAHVRSAVFSPTAAISPPAQTTEPYGSGTGESKPSWRSSTVMQTQWTTSSSSHRFQHSRQRLHGGFAPAVWTLDAPPLPAFRGHRTRVDLLVRTRPDYSPARPTSRRASGTAVARQRFCPATRFGPSGTDSWRETMRPHRRRRRSATTLAVTRTSWQHPAAAGRTSVTGRKSRADPDCLDFRGRVAHPDCVSGRYGALVFARSTARTTNRRERPRCRTPRCADRRGRFSARRECKSDGCRKRDGVALVRG